MKNGIDRLLRDKDIRKKLYGKRVALVAHPASVTEDLTHSIDALVACDDIELTAAFGPQHGLKGDKQDNMVETPDEIDPDYNIPIFSLYGEVRRPTADSMETFDVILFDLQDLGCRIYTYLTTLRYMLEACAEHGKEFWVLDRPNPAGRPIEGLSLRPGWESFVGAAALPMRHGLTMAEMARYFVKECQLDVDLEIVAIDGWQPGLAPEFGWPANRIWINPSPNAPNVMMARAYAGTVMLEGTTLSEGRGTTRPLELFGAPDINTQAILKKMEQLAPDWMKGCTLRPCSFEPTFHKHVGQLCHGIQFHAEGPNYDHHAFRPWRLQSLAFKAIRLLQPDYPLWRDFPYEYEYDKLAIDVINGSTLLREWVDDAGAEPGDLEALTVADEITWREQIRDFVIYPE